ncbi:hypothetical protein D9758_011284 [Tetrapyrgos nigripes]|uniref:Major facilitator superfamily (MFS) profile domain-containing protein n=2 Tax=Tetrapyrgos nigripes TaxID=182062 RepID=A0A8H5CVF0_9AGAR|nr:hypothetical protein D9758_011284 [Tetrapyrgos nigripes]
MTTAPEVVPLPSLQTDPEVPTLEMLNSDPEKPSSSLSWEEGEENPRNWSESKKWVTIVLVSAYAFVTPLGSSMMAPALPQISERFSITSPTITALTLSIFLLTFSFGPLLFAPLSECYGRTWVFHLTNIGYLAFTLGCAFASSTGSLLGFRLLAGFFGSAALAVGGGSVADLFAPAERGNAMALFSLGPLLASSLGPVFGGFVTQTIGYNSSPSVPYSRLLMGTAAAACGLCSLIAIPLLQETYAPVLKYRHSLKSNLGLDPEELRKIHPTFAYGSLWRFLWANLKRPLIILATSLICFVLSLYLAYMWGIYYIMFTTFPGLFSNVYGFSLGLSGLAFIGLGLGFTTATFAGGLGGNLIYRRLAARNGGKGTPEMRIPLLIVGSVLMPIGIFWYGWSAQAQIHWIMPIIGTAIFGFAVNMSSILIQLYLVDSFTYAASSVAAASTFRSLLGFAFPLFGAQLYEKLDYGGGNR